MIHTEEDNISKITLCKILKTPINTQPELILIFLMFFEAIEVYSRQLSNISTLNE